MNTKNLYGITFEALHNATTSEIVDTVVKNTLAQIKEGLALSGSSRKYTEVYMEKSEKYLPELMAHLFDDQFLDGLRKLYDTEERFNLSIDITHRVSHIGAKVQPITERIYQEMMDEDVLE